MTFLRRVFDAVHLYLLLVAASARAQMQYRVSFLTQCGTDFVGMLCDFLPIYFLMRRFEGLQGWGLAEIALLYGMVGVSWGVAELTFRGFEQFGQYLVAGELDRWLLRPRGVVLQVASSHFEPHRVGRIFQACLVLSASVVVLRLSPPAIGWVALGVAGGTLLFVGIVMFAAGTQFWTLGQTSELQNMLTYGGTAALSYPMSIYETWFRRVLTYGVPLAFVNYFPALAALGRTGRTGLAPYLPLLSPVVCSGMALLGAAFFHRGLGRYESTGS